MSYLFQNAVEHVPKVGLSVAWSCSCGCYGWWTVSWLDELARRHGGHVLEFGE